MVDSLASGVPLAAEHAQVLDRLRQLTVWQQAQQERLRAHQQQQIAILRGEHASTSPLVPSVTQLEPVGSPNPHSQCQGPPSPSSPPSQRPGNQTCADSTAVVNSEWTGLQQVQQYGELEQPVVTGGRGNEGSGGERGGGEGSGCVSDSGLETGGQGSEEETELTRGGEEATGGGEDRPIQSGVGESGTFEELVERQMRLHCGDEVETCSPRTYSKPHPFLRRGEGLARFNWHPRSSQSLNKQVKTSMRPPTQPPSQAVIPPTRAMEPLTQDKRPPSQAVIPPTRAMEPLTQDKRPLSQAVIPLTRAMEPLTQDKRPPSQAVIPPTRAMEPLTQDKRPLSQAVIPPSQAMEPLTQDKRPPSQAVIPPSRAMEPLTQDKRPLSQAVIPPSQAVEPLTQDERPLSQAVEPLTQDESSPSQVIPHDRPATETPAPGMRISGPTPHSVAHVQGSLLGSQFSSDESFLIRGTQREKQEEAELVEFEQLEQAAMNCSSFSQNSLIRGVLGEGPQVSPPPEGVRGVDGDVRENGELGDLDKTLTPSQTEEVRGQSLAAGVVFSDDEEWESFSRGSPSPPPSIHQSEESPWTSPTRQTVSSTPLTTSPPPQSHSSQPHLPHQHSHPPSEDLPPPSALAARLFPALRREREQLLQTQHPLPQPTVEEKTTHPVTTPPRYPSEPEVREKLCQLETEIERFRTLNSKLEQQNKEKEQSLSFLKGEISEFQQQMKQEMEQFEMYKCQETRKIRKERRVFEEYVQQCRAGQERKDREEIEALRDEVQQLREELASREERWRAALSRQRQRVESLESQNRELQGDLRMMERERLSWWQQQLEQREDTPPPPSPPPSISQPPTTHTKPHITTVRGQPPGTRRTTVGRGRERKRGRQTRAAEKRPSAKTAGVDVKEKENQLRRDQSSPSVKPEEEERLDHLKTGPPSTTTCEIVEVISRDLSPPQSDLWSGGEPDMSALAEDIVNRVIGPRERDQGKGPGSCSDGGDKATEKTSKSVRFAVEDTAGPSEARGVEGDGEGEERRDQPAAETVQEDGSTVTVCSNGTRRIVSSDGQSVMLEFCNGDTKHIQPDRTVVYYYCQSQTTHITHPDGLQELHFTNQQKEKLYPDGRKEIMFPDGTVKTVQPCGEEESVFVDGTLQRVLVDGSRVIEYVNGQRETHTKEYKRREYPDGTVKTVFPDGRQETHYASGRLRVKDKTGRVIMDRLSTDHS